MTEPERQAQDECASEPSQVALEVAAANDGSPGSPRHVGEVLSARRTALGLSVQDVATRLKLSLKTIHGLEAGAHEKLGQPSVVRGFVRAYARMLELDPAEVLPLLPDVPNPVTALSLEPTLSAPLPSGMSRGSTVWWLRGLAVAAVMVAMAIMLGRYGVAPVQALFERSSTEGPIAQQLESRMTELASAVPVGAPSVDSTPTAPPSVSNTIRTESPGTPAALTPSEQVASTVSALVAPAANAAAWGEGPLRINVQSESWLEVSDASGKVLVSALQPTGSRQALAGRAPFTLVVGNAPGVQVEYQGKAVDLSPYTRGNVARVVLN